MRHAGHVPWHAGEVTRVVSLDHHLQPKPGLPHSLSNLIFKLLPALSFQMQAQQGTGWFGEAKAVGALLCHSQK